ncbi:MAG: CHAT domain-containing protein, partial [Chloroflexales bacterium]|nr:CHAT domain-containing protein [Chloroflexales bacterium]
GLFLASDARLLLARYLPSDDPTPVAPGISAAPSALIAVAAPRDLASYKLAEFDPARAAAAAQAALAGFTTRASASASLEWIADELRDAPDVLYLMCHSTISGGEPYLFLERPDGKSAAVAGARLVELLRSLPRRPYLVVLAACQSAGASDNEGSGRVALGPRLARVGIAAVVAMLDKITLDAAGAGVPVMFEELRRHGEIDRAMAVMRGQLAVSSADWWSPVLFLRAW